MDKIQIGDIIYFMNQDDHLIESDEIVEITQTTDGYKYMTKLGKVFINPEELYVTKQALVKSWLEANDITIGVSFTDASDMTTSIYGEQ